MHAKCKKVWWLCGSVVANASRFLLQFLVFSHMFVVQSCVSSLLLAISYNHFCAIIWLLSLVVCEATKGIWMNLKSNVMDFLYKTKRFTRRKVFNLRGQFKTLFETISNWLRRNTSSLSTKKFDSGSLKLLWVLSITIITVWIQADLFYKIIYKNTNIFSWFLQSIRYLILQL